MVKQYALEIERLLRLINPQRQYGCDDIEMDPYVAIFQELNGRVSTSLLQRFETYYKAIEGQTLSNLILSKYDVKTLIVELKDIVNIYLKEIN